MSKQLRLIKNIISGINTKQFLPEKKQIIFQDKNEDWLFVLDYKDKILWVSYHTIWKVLKIRQTDFKIKILLRKRINIFLKENKNLGEYNFFYLAMKSKKIFG